ncbi:hypothetical protein PsorP6_016130 [Peronosclerospora sorghi]|uniref:Uncharacterized protein n=1 Tax=Peronosclerospora sorghi TaxID=230839 RepID=A0ACC0VLQ6_9STRA|nr:hypothetical protein PsorP6_016130 [Peronosclerospora sorghi]
MGIRSMIDRIKKMTEVEGPLTDEELREKNDNEFIGDLTISITGFLDDQVLLIHDIVANLSEDNQLLVKREVGQLITGFVLGVSRIFLGWEKNENRESLSNISLEGVLQAKQFDQLQQLK